jgi:hypothetical protein
MTGRKKSIGEVEEKIEAMKVEIEGLREEIRVWEKKGGKISE